MTLLLDTHALLWWLADDPALTPEARTAIRAAGTRVFVSAATAWEISIKQALGKLEAPDDLEAALAASRFQSDFDTAWQHLRKPVRKTLSYCRSVR